MDEFEKILDVISNHNASVKGPNGELIRTHEPLETLTRLYRKNQNDDTLPPLDRSNVKCWEEERPKQAFCEICDDVENTKKVSEHDSGHQIVVLVRNGHEFILDGHKRCRFWRKRNDTSDHTALFIEPLKDIMRASSG